MRCKVVKAEVSSEEAADLGAVLIAVQIDLLVFDAAPQALNNHVVDPASFAIHADGNTGVVELRDPFVTGKLRSFLHSEFWFATVS